MHATQTDILVPSFLLPDVSMPRLFTAPLTQQFQGRCIEYNCVRPFSLRAHISPQSSVLYMHRTVIATLQNRSVGMNTSPEWGFSSSNA